MKETYIICAAIAFLCFFIIAIYRIFFKNKPIELDISYDDFEFSNRLDKAELRNLRLKNIELRNKNCELIDKLNAFESQPQYDTEYRIGAYGRLTFIGMNQGQYLYAPSKHINHSVWIIVKKDKPMEDLIGEVDYEKIKDDIKEGLHNEWQWGAKEYHQYCAQTDGFKQPFQKLPTQ